MSRMRQAPQTRHALVSLRDIAMRLAPGERLPSELEMMSRLRVSRMTLRRAVDVLKREGLIIAEHSKGFFRTAAGGQKPQTISPVIALAIANMDSNIQFFNTVTAEAARLSIAITAGAIPSAVHEQEAYLRSLLQQPGLRGLIVNPPIISADLEALMEAYHALQRGGIHVVFANAPYAGIRIDNVSFDDATGMAILTRHLLDLGHREVAFVGDTTGHVRAHQREQGYRQVMRTGGYKGLLIKSQLQNDKTLFSPDPVAAVRKQGVTAFVALNDKIAFQLWTMLEAAGIQAPRDVSIAGFDRLEHITYAFPRALTSVRRDRCELGRIALRLLWTRCLAGGVPGGAHQHILLPVEFLPGASTGQPPPAI